MKLLQLRLLVKDFKKSAEFYRDVLELPVGWYEESMEYAIFNNGETKIELLSRNAMAQVIGEENGSEEAVPFHFLLQFNVEDVDSVYQHLQEKGVNFLTEPHDRKEWGARIAHFRDPEGNLIEIYKML
ncbi:VOC family protein [Fictibacillus gelatini]|uniref:VOC family protein n=1 Tax=Fictibacillus gelatini TaxID=225985 RepID=UPI00047928CF|nr:VOC family protein [Fictibacillus gelatini]